jgi:hypothetical protein
MSGKVLSIATVYLIYLRFLNIRHPNYIRGMVRGVLGLDVSCSSTGWVLLSNTGRVLKCGAVPAARLSVMDAALKVSGEILGELADTPCSHWSIGIEDYLKHAGGPSWTTKSLFKLAEMNAMMRVLMFKALAAVPEPIPARTARAMFGLNAGERSRTGNKEIKEIVLRFAEPFVSPVYAWELKRTGRVKDHCYDIADAFVIARYKWATMEESIPLPEDSP